MPGWLVAGQVQPKRVVWHRQTAHQPLTWATRSTWSSGVQGSFAPGSFQVQGLSTLQLAAWRGQTLFATGASEIEGTIYLEGAGEEISTALGQ